MKLAAIGVASAAIAACSGMSGSIPAPSNNQLPSQTAPGGGTVQVSGLDLNRVRIMHTLANQPSHVTPDILLNYNGGPVEVKAQVFVVFWGFTGSGDPSGEKKYLTAFLNGVGGSKWMNIDHQYYELSGGKKFIVNGASQLKGTWVDKSVVPSSPTDAQIQAEAAKAVTHFGFNKDASYVVATPHNHNTGGFGSSFCAYHGATSTSKGIASYTNLPYMTDAGSNCGQNFINGGIKGKLDGVSIVEGHEYAESQTDPQPISGWYNNSYGEIGDLCAWLKPPAGDITLSTGKFAVQGLFDNKKMACEISGP
jgi:serine protease